MLQHAVESFEGRKPQPLYTGLGERIKPMPKPGEVDFIYGGRCRLTTAIPRGLTMISRPSLPRILSDESQ